MRLALLALLAVGCDGEALGDRTINVALGFSDTTNFGPETATGSAIIETSSGRVELRVAGMPQLAGDLYEGWLRGGGEEPLSIGTFNSSGAGAAVHAANVGDLTASTFEGVVVTVEDDPDDDPDVPDVRETIAGDIPF